MALAVRVPVGPPLELWRADGRKIIVESGSEMHLRLEAGGWQRKEPAAGAAGVAVAAEAAEAAQPEYHLQTRGPAWAVVVNRDGEVVTPSLRKAEARRWIEEHDA